MSDSIKIDPLPEENPAMDFKPASPWPMLFTMLLLIAGFLFASMLLIQQALKAEDKFGYRILDPQAIVEELERQAPASPPYSGQQSLEPAPSTPMESIKEVVQNPTGKVHWPSLKLDGFGKSADGNEEYAIINGDLIHPGEYTGKVKLSEVRTQDVIVEYKGEYKTLTLEIEN
ncbi:MAG: hypothetical protein JXR25_10535 [Pontiellaceae bacterium]|nr:hypothetical protein [Pontiellaceae bacterium]MBN2785256.1 hypothetical protein [Pontiellaceae bacterium]